VVQLGRNLTSLAAILATAALLLVGASVALGDGNGAVVVKGDTCGILFSSDGQLQAITTNDSHGNTTPSGNSHIQCHGQVPDNLRPSGGAVQFNGQPCRTPNGQITTDSHTVLTPSGQINLQCHFKG
jgi:hypothetical protein